MQDLLNLSLSEIGFWSLQEGFFKQQNQTKMYNFNRKFWNVIQSSSRNLGRDPTFPVPSFLENFAAVAHPPDPPPTTTSLNFRIINTIITLYDVNKQGRIINLFYQGESGGGSTLSKNEHPCIIQRRICLYGL